MCVCVCVLSSAGKHAGLCVARTPSYLRNPLRGEDKAHTVPTPIKCGDSARMRSRPACRGCKSKPHPKKHDPTWLSPQCSRLPFPPSLCTGFLETERVQGWSTSVNTHPSLQTWTSPGRLLFRTCTVGVPTWMSEPVQARLPQCAQPGAASPQQQQHCSAGISGVFVGG